MICIRTGIIQNAGGKSILLVNIYGFSVGIQGVSRLITFKERAYIINKHANSITHAKLGVFSVSASANRASAKQKH